MVPTDTATESGLERFKKLLAEKKLLPMPPLSSDPVNEYNTPGLLSMAFPALFPDGVGHYFRAGNRPICKVTFNDYCLHLMSDREPRFREHRIFKFFCFNFLLRNTIMQKCNLAIPKNQFTDLDPQQSSLFEKMPSNINNVTENADQLLNACMRHTNCKIKY